MTSADETGEIAAEAEALDARLIEMLAERWRLLEREIAAPGLDASFRPDREAAAVRRFVERSAGRLPAAAASRVWRSFAAEMLPLRGVKACLALATTLNAARGYVGFATPVIEAAEVREALERADAGKGELACLPWPEHAGPGQWWPMLNENRFRGLAILDGWPRWPGGGAPRAAMVGRAPVRGSGADDTLLTAHDDRHDAERLLAEAGLVGEIAARARSLVLIRLKEFAGEADPRLDAARSAGLDGLRVIGVLPRP